MKTISYKSIAILLASLLTFFVIMAATDAPNVPPKPKVTTVLSGTVNDIRDFIISKTKEGYQVTHLSMSSSSFGVVVMSKY